MPRLRWSLVERDQEDESSEEEAEDEELEESSDGQQEEEDEGEEANEQEDESAEQQKSRAERKRISISLKGTKNLICHVCGKKGHKAGFVGATYLDCPNKACYLCKKMGHTTTTCPYRISPGHGCTSASSSAKGNLLSVLRGREQDGKQARYGQIPPSAGNWEVQAAILKLHTRRCCCLEFHPTLDGIVLSGDKKGHIAVWDFDKVHDRTCYEDIHKALVNTMRFVPWLDSMSCCSASSDGCVSLFDIETGSHSTLLNLNPGGWIEGVTDPKDWKMMYGCAVSSQLGLVLAGDSIGVLHLLDPRANKAVNSIRVHDKAGKIGSVDVNPVHPELVLTGSNDHSCKLLDLRMLSSTDGSAHSNGAPNTRTDAPPSSGRRGRAPAEARRGSGAGASTSRSSAPGAAAASVVGSRAELAVMPHPRVVNAAYFSPSSGTKVMTTCQDNRIRVWDNLLSCSDAADREIVHSHDFNRYLTPFRAEWDPKDVSERIVTCGRYISEDYGGVALHPLDILDASTGNLLRELTDLNITTISPVNKPHPRRNIIISGSSRSLYLWAPAEDSGDREGVAGAAARGGADAASMMRKAANFRYFDADAGATDAKKKRRKKGDDSD